jgi:hypothetical protein
VTSEVRTRAAAAAAASIRQDEEHSQLTHSRSGINGANWSATTDAPVSMDSFSVLRVRVRCHEPNFS